MNKTINPANWSIDEIEELASIHSTWVENGMVKYFDDAYFENTNEI